MPPILKAGRFFYPSMQFLIVFKANKLKDAIHRPDAYVLEAPFNSMKSEVGTFMIAHVMKFLINVDRLLEESDMTFNSELFIKNIREPVFIMHAEDDGVIPFELGKQLYHIAMNHSCDVTFFPFEGSLHLGHDYIYKADSFTKIVGDIVSKVNQCEKA